MTELAYQQQPPDQIGKTQDGAGPAASPSAAPDRRASAAPDSDKAPLAGQHAPASDATASARFLAYVTSDRQYASEPGGNSPADAGPQAPHAGSSPDAGTAAISPRTQAYMRGDRQYSAPHTASKQPSDVSQAALAPTRADTSSAASQKDQRPETGQPPQQPRQNDAAPQRRMNSPPGERLASDADATAGTPARDARSDAPHHGRDRDAGTRQADTRRAGSDEVARTSPGLSPRILAYLNSDRPYAAAPAASDRWTIRAVNAVTGLSRLTALAQYDAARTPVSSADSRTEPIPREHPRRFADSRAAVQFVKAGAETGEVGSASSQFDHHLSKPNVVRSPDGGYSASADVTWTFSNERSTTTITRPEWPHMSAADRAAVQQFVKAMREHEAGHHRVARDYMADAGRTITAHGSTPREATRNLQRALDRYQQRTKRALDAKGAEYDRITEHGNRQEVVGGTNVRLDVP